MFSWCWLINQQGVYAPNTLRARLAISFYLTIRDLYPLFYCSARQTVSTVIVANGKKIDISKQGLNSVENKTVKLNLMGKSETMKKKDWVDPSGRKGKVRFWCNCADHAVNANESLSGIKRAILVL